MKTNPTLEQVLESANRTASRRGEIFLGPLLDDLKISPSGSKASFVGRTLDKLVRQGKIKRTYEKQTVTHYFKK